MRRLICLLIFGVLVASSSLVMAQAPGSTDTATPAQTDHKFGKTLTGCLKQSNEQYYVQEKDGTRHILLANGQDLKPYIDHVVTLTGKRNSTPDATTTNDEGAATSSHYFSVDQVSDQGPCKR